MMRIINRDLQGQILIAVFISFTFGGCHSKRKNSIESTVFEIIHFVLLSTMF